MVLANSNVQTTKPILTKIAPNRYFGLYIGQTPPPRKLVPTSVKNTKLLGVLYVVVYTTHSPKMWPLNK